MKIQIKIGIEWNYFEYLNNCEYEENLKFI